MKIKQFTQIISLLSLGLSLSTQLQAFGESENSSASQTDDKTSNPFKEILEKEYAFLLGNEESWVKEYKSFLTKDRYFDQFAKKFAILAYGTIKPPKLIEYFLGFYHFYDPYSEQYGKLDDTGKGAIVMVEFILLPFLKAEQALHCSLLSLQAFTETPEIKAASQIDDQSSCLLPDNGDWEKEYEAFATGEWGNSYFDQFRSKYHMLTQSKMKEPEISAYFLGFYRFYKPGGKRYEELSKEKKYTFEHIEFKINQFLKTKRVLQ